MKNFFGKILITVGFLMLVVMLTCSSEILKVQFVIFLIGFAGLGLMCLGFYMSDRCDLRTDMKIKY